MAPPTDDFFTWSWPLHIPSFAHSSPPLRTRLQQTSYSTGVCPLQIQPFFVFLPPAHTPPTYELFTWVCTWVCREGVINLVVRAIRHNIFQGKFGLSPSSYNAGALVFVLPFCLLPYGVHNIAYSISVEETEDEDRYY